jgi:hypothetical protein
MFKRHDREGSVEIVLAEIMPAECATEFGQGLFETVVLYGSLYEVVSVPKSPIWLVATASAESSVSGSSRLR